MLLRELLRECPWFAISASAQQFREWLGRIVAFAAVGLLLFLLGFAYQALARRIEK